MAKIAACILLALQSPVQTVRKLQAQIDDTDMKGKYDVPEKPVGEGSFGVVYKATNKSDGKQVAIKYMKGEVSEDTLKKQCEKVQELHNQIEKNPGKNHVMNCLESQLKYVVYEWAGTEGSQLLPTLSFEAALALLKQVIIALHALYQSPSTPIVHHDLKWQNVAVNDHGCLKLIDLDDWLFANWGNRLEITVSTPIFSPPEYLREGPKRRNYFCGLTASPEIHALSPCPGAYSFDMFSAGIMALQVCAFEWMYFALHFNEQVTSKGVLGKRIQQELMLYYAAEDTLYFSIPFRGIDLLSDALFQGESLSTYVSKFDPNQILEVAKHFKEKAICESLLTRSDKCKEEDAQKKRDEILMQHAANAKKKFESCQALSGYQLGIIQKMVSKRPQDRPEPAWLLNSELFKSVSTSCPWDTESSYVESMSSEISDEELEEYDLTAINQDKLEIEELIAADSQDPANASKKEEIIEKLQKIGKPHGQDPVEIKIYLSMPQAQSSGSQLKCHGCDNPEPVLIKVQKKKKQIQRRDKMGRPLAFCYFDEMVVPAPVDCTFINRVPRSGHMEAQYRCSCFDLSKGEIGEEHF